MTRPLCALVCGLIGALLACLVAPDAFVLPAAALCALFLALWTMLRRRAGLRAGYPAAAAFGLALGFIWWTAYGALFYAPAARLAHTSGVAEMTVLDEPDLYDDGLTARVLVRLTSYRGKTVRFTKAYLYLEIGSGVEPGDTVRALVGAALPSEDSGSLDRFRAQGVYLILTARGAAAVAKPARAPLSTLPGRAERALRERLSLIFPPDCAGVVAALILGDRDGLPDGFSQAMRDTGLSHLTAVSGANLSFLVGVIMLLFRRRLGTALSIPAVLFFMLMTGGTSSVVRAGIMQLLWLFSFLVRREADSPTSLFFAVGSMLLFNPYMIADAGLWLSFAATLGLVTASGPLADRLTRLFSSRRPEGRTAGRLSGKLVRLAASALSAAVCAQLFVLPIQMIVFGELSLIALPANLLVGWSAQGAFFGGALAAAASCFGLPAGQVCAFPAVLLVRYQLRIVPAMASLPYATVSAGSFYTGAAVVFGYLLLLYAAWRKPGRRALTLAGCCFAVCLCVCSAARALESRYTLYAAVLDTGGGQCVALCAGGSGIVVNCGGYRADVRAADFLSGHDLRALDLLILTDYKQSSLRGAADLMTRLPVRHLVLPLPASDADRAAGEALLRAAEGTGCAVTLVSDGTVTLTVGALTAEILVNGADTGFGEPKGFDVNRFAVLVGSPDCRVLVPGSIAPDRLAALLSGRSCQNVLLTAAGGYYSSHELPAFPDGDAPLCVLTSWAGAPAALTRALAERGVAAADTLDKGTVTLRRGLPAG